MTFPGPLEYTQQSLPDDSNTNHPLDEQGRLDRMVATLMRLRSLGISDVAVLNAIERIPHDLFLPDVLKAFAYHHESLPLAEEHGYGWKIPAPSFVAAVAGALDLKKNMSILEIGTGSGYQTAVLSLLCRRVFTIDRDLVFYRDADERFKALDLRNIVNRHGDGSKGWPQENRFDRIIINAACHQVNKRILSQLSPEGFVIAPLGLHQATQHLYRVFIDEAGQVITRQIMRCDFPPLVENHTSSS